MSAKLFLWGIEGVGLNVYTRFDVKLGRLYMEHAPPFDT